MKWHFVVVVRYVLYLTERHKKSTLQKNKKTAHTERKNKNSDQANKRYVKPGVVRVANISSCQQSVWHFGRGT